MQIEKASPRWPSTSDTSATSPGRSETPGTGGLASEARSEAKPSAAGRPDLLRPGTGGRAETSTVDVDVFSRATTTGRGVVHPPAPKGSRPFEVEVIDRAEGPIKVACYDYGHPSAKDVCIAVPGLTRGGPDFHYLARGLAGQDRRFVAITLPGRGTSDPLEHAPAESPLSPAYNPKREAELVAQVLERLNLGRDKNITLVGTSRGVLVNMLVALKDPRVKALVMNDVSGEVTFEQLIGLTKKLGHDTQATFKPAPGFDASNITADNIEKAIPWTDPDFVKYFHERLHAFGYDLARDNPDAWKNLVRSSLCFDREQGVFRMNYDPDVVGPAPDPLQREIFLRTFENNPLLQATFNPWLGFDYWKVYNELCARGLPILVIRGADSTILQPDQLAKMQGLQGEHKIPGGFQNVSVLQYPGAGHAPSLAVETQIQDVRTWLERIRQDNYRAHPHDHIPRLSENEIADFHIENAASRILRNAVKTGEAQLGAFGAYLNFLSTLTNSVASAGVSWGSRS